MGRKVRMVHKDWIHPKDEFTGIHKPLFEGDRYESTANAFMEKANLKGLQSAIDYYGQAPDQEDYMPSWADEEKTHFMMYEDTSEGTPISPAFETPEELARWLVDNNASSLGSSTASYEAWLNIAKGGWAPSMVYSQETGLINGVDFALQHK